ncbi:MAG: hypothetical protein PHG06_00440 [Parabacteroides sp.]|nr:hypothetical protein [Parabacteroides sp.]
MKETLLSLLIPGDKAECGDLVCGGFHIMHETLYGERLPHCLCFEKSMDYLKMLVVVE